MSRRALTPHQTTALGHRNWPTVRRARESSRIDFAKPLTDKELKAFQPPNDPYITLVCAWCRGHGVTCVGAWGHGGAAGEDGCAWQFAVFFLLSCLMYFSIFFLLCICVFMSVFFRFFEAIAFGFAVRYSPRRPP